MQYDIMVKPVAPMAIAAVRRKVRIPDIATAWKSALDEVWAFMRQHPELKPVRNVFLYHHPTQGDAAMNVDFGVAVTGAFSGDGAIRAASTPAGTAACVTHVGPYSGIPDAHAAIHAWREREGRQFAGWSWEIYGDWNEDQSKLETEVVYLLG
jgi:effector-binding domain-containing protein